MASETYRVFDNKDLRHTKIRKTENNILTFRKPNIKMSKEYQTVDTCQCPKTFNPSSEPNFGSETSSHIFSKIMAISTLNGVNFS